MPSRRRVLALATGAVSVVPFAGCTVPVGPVPRVGDQPCPPLDSIADRSVCSHTDSTGGIGVSVSPTTVSTAPESLSDVTIRIENGTDRPLAVWRSSSGRWRLYRTTGFGWNERDVPDSGSVAPDAIEPGGAFSVSGLDALFRLGATGSTPAGLYAAVLTVGRGASAAGTERNTGTPVDCVCLFRVSGA